MNKRNKKILFLLIRVLKINTILENKQDLKTYLSNTQINKI